VMLPPGGVNRDTKTVEDHNSSAIDVAAGTMALPNAESIPLVFAHNVCRGDPRSGQCCILYGKHYMPFCKYDINE
jgi:hypothetical protein